MTSWFLLNLIIFSDSQSALSLIQNPVNHQRSKHIDIRYHFIREKLASGIIDYQYIPTDKNVSDIMTKPANKHVYGLFTCSTCYSCLTFCGHCILQVLQDHVGVLNIDLAVYIYLCIYLLLIVSSSPCIRQNTRFCACARTVYILATEALF